MPAPWSRLRQAAAGGSRRGWSIRLRLTVLYGAVFVVSGAVLLAVTYTLVAGRLHRVTFVANVGGAQFAQPAGAGGQRIVIATRSAAPRTPIVATPPPGAQTLIDQLNILSGRQRADSLHLLLLVSFVALALMVFVSMGLGWLVAGRALQPLRAMTTAARQLSEHNLHERLPESGPRDELRELATTFNAVLGRLEAAFESQRRFVANASHELRTPLTLERAVLEVALADPTADADSLRATCERVLAIGVEQEALIEALLTLARSQRGLERRETVDLAATTTDAVETAGPAAGARSISIEAALEPAPTAGDPRLIERLVTNLVDNAVRHNIPGGTIDVRTGTTAGCALLRVANTGPVVPADQVDRLLQPFQRLAPDRAGHPSDGLGMGLSIVAAIASAHDATLAVQPRPNGGLVVEVRFPLAAGP